LRLTRSDLASKCKVVTDPFTLVDDVLLGSDLMGLLKALSPLCLSRRPEPVVFLEAAGDQGRYRTRVPERWYSARCRSMCLLAGYNPGRWDVAVHRQWCPTRLASRRERERPCETMLPFSITGHPCRPPPHLPLTSPTASLFFATF
jgi:hypothetical protein